MRFVARALLVVVGLLSCCLGTILWGEVGNPQWWFGGFGLLCLILAGALAPGPPVCHICGNLIHKKGYFWTIDGKEVKACPPCSAQLRQRISRDSVKQFMEKRGGKR